MKRVFGRPENAEVRLSVDVAVRVLHGLLRAHRVPASRIARHERGLTWWGPRLAQRFAVSGPVDTGAGRTWWLGFEADFLAGFEPGSRAQLATATMLGWSFELFTAGIEQDKVVLRGRTYALEADQPRGVAARAAELGRRALVASQVAHTYARWYLDGTLRLPEDGVRVDTSAPPGPGADAAIKDLPDPAPAPGAILAAANLDLAPVATVLTDRGMTPLDAPQGTLAFGGRLPTSQRDVVVLLDSTATQPHVGPGLSASFSPVGLADDRAASAAAAINAAVWETFEPPVGMGSWSGRREIGLSYGHFLPYCWTTPTALMTILADDLGHVLQADRTGWVAPL